MNIEILYQPSYAMAKVGLKAGEALVAEAGVMVAMSGSIQVDTGLRGGMLKSLARSLLGGESFFTNTFQAGDGGGEVFLAPTFPGDIYSLDLKNETYYVQSGSFLASSREVDVNAAWSGAKTFFAGEGFVMLRCSGSGNMLLSSYGAIHAVDLSPGQVLRVDTGHLVAFSEAVGFQVRPVGGVKSTILSGEGLVVELTGAGRVLVQSRSEKRFLSWLLARIPKRES